MSGGLTNTFVQNLIEPSNFNLFQNYPNPFNSSTLIKFRIEEISFVNLDVFDINGKLIQRVINKRLVKGLHKEIFNGNELSSGIYFFRLRASNTTYYFSETKKFLLVN